MGWHRDSYPFVLRSHVERLQPIWWAERLPLGQRMVAFWKFEALKWVVVLCCRGVTSPTKRLRLWACRSELRRSRRSVPVMLTCLTIRFLLPLVQFRTSLCYTENLLSIAWRWWKSVSEQRSRIYRWSVVRARNFDTTAVKNFLKEQIKFLELHQQWDGGGGQG